MHSKSPDGREATPAERARRSSLSAVLGRELSVGGCKTQGRRRRPQPKAHSREPLRGTEKRRLWTSVTSDYGSATHTGLLRPSLLLLPTLRTWKRSLSDVEGRTEGLSALPCVSWRQARADHTRYFTLMESLILSRTGSDWTMPTPLQLTRFYRNDRRKSRL